MIRADAEAHVARVLTPTPVRVLFDAVQASVPLAITAEPASPRVRLLGDHAEATLLAAYATLAPVLDCHAIEPLGPPPGPKTVGSASDFAALIAAYHDRNYTVRLPEVRALTPDLLLFVRSLEILLDAPVEASVFWSRAGARAKVHYDNNDNIVVQLSGRKRWFVSTAEPGLQTPWRDIAEPQPHLERHSVIDLAPGDWLYTPRGLPHSVVSTTDSLHLAILFTPLTRRAAMAAVVDHIAELSRTTRQTSPDADVAPDLARCFADAAERCGQPGFVDAALARYRGRVVADLERLVAPVAEPALAPVTRVRHAALSAMHLRETGQTVEVALPGGRIAVHAAAGPALDFIAQNRSFLVGDLPGLPPEVAAALVARLAAAGLLEVGG